MNGPKGRFMVQLVPGSACVSAFLLGIGVPGGSNAAYEWRALVSLGVLLAVMLLWGWIEYQFANPGLLVLPATRQIAGVRDARDRE